MIGMTAAEPNACPQAWLQTRRAVYIMTHSMHVNCRANFISSDLIANMQGDKAALLAEVQARMVANPEMAKGIGLDPIDPNDSDLYRPVSASGVCPFSSGQSQTPKGRLAANGVCPMGY